MLSQTCNLISGYEIQVPNILLRNFWIWIWIIIANLLRDISAMECARLRA